MSNEDFENFKNIICPIFHQYEGKRILEEWKKKITDKNFLDSLKK